MRFPTLLFACLLSIQTIKAQTDSLDIKIGQMLMVGLSGTSANDSSQIIRDIRAGKIGGILLFEYNLNPVNTIKNLATLTSKLQNTAKIPLLISIDQEGGQVNRLKTKYGFKAMPSAKAVGDSHSDDYATQVAFTIANSLQLCGINLNYAPVLDIHNPNCPVLGKRQRCYSDQVDSITHYAGLMIEQHHQLGIKTVVKHFPGHGSSLNDSHLGLVDVTKTWNEKEVQPYQSLLDEGVVDAIMTAHIINRKLDSSGTPATLSKKIVTDYLRKKMGFKGVVISDDMQMHAISSYYGLDESIRKCINAGVDILMFSNNIKGATKYTPSNVHAVIKRLVNQGKIPMQRINESYARIMAMKVGGR